MGETELHPLLDGEGADHETSVSRYDAVADALGYPPAARLRETAVCSLRTAAPLRRSDTLKNSYSNFFAIRSPSTVSRRNSLPVPQAGTTSDIARFRRLDRFRATVDRSSTCRSVRPTRSATSSAYPVCCRCIAGFRRLGTPPRAGSSEVLVNVLIESIRAIIFVRCLPSSDGGSGLPTLRGRRSGQRTGAAGDAVGRRDYSRRAASIRAAISSTCSARTCTAAS